MIQKLPIGFVVAVAVALTTNLAAKEPDKEEPLRKRVFISNSVGTTLMLLDTELVRKEIGLTDAQKAKIEPLKKAIRDAYEKIFRANPVTPESEKEDTVKLDSTNTKDIITKYGSATIPIGPGKLSHRTIKIDQATKEADERVQKQLDEILQPGQLDRIWEIILQSECFFQAGGAVMGGLPDLDKELYKLLAISEDQVNEINAIHRNTELALSRIFEVAGEELKKMPKEQLREIVHKKFEKMRPIVDRANEQLQAELTPKQRDAIAKMKGKEIDYINLVEQSMFNQTRETPAEEKK
jgi:hypothetical protein